jgi:hypothetical protein
MRSRSELRRAAQRALVVPHHDLRARGLLDHERAVGSTPDIAGARRRGEDYLLARRMFRRRSTGEVVDPSFVAFSFPPRYGHDVLRGLDYLRDAGVAPDERWYDARPETFGRWPGGSSHSVAVSRTGPGSSRRRSSSRP